MRTSTVLLVCVAALLVASSAQAAIPRRHLTQAIASSTATAGPGETVNANSNANSENGQLTVSKVDASGAGPGTTVNCNQAASNGQIKSKNCPGPSGTATSSSTATGWFAAPACKNAPSTYTVTRGTDNKPWGFENDTRTSCALRGPKDEPLA